MRMLLCDRIPLPIEHVWDFRWADKEYNQPFLNFPAPFIDSLRCQPKQLAFFSPKLHHGGSASPITGSATAQDTVFCLTGPKTVLQRYSKQCGHHGIMCCSVTFCLLSCGTRNHARIHFNLQPWWDPTASDRAEVCISRGFRTKKPQLRDSWRAPRA